MGRSKTSAILIILAMMCILTSCKKEQYNNQKTSNKKNTESLVTEERKNDNDSENNILLVDYNKYFAGINGCIVIYDADGKTYSVYNEEMVNNEASPYSTFKVVGTLAGLNNNVLQDEDSKMNYNGEKYPIDSWNGDLTLKQAVQTSCVWYFRQVIDEIGEEKILDELTKLHYGNCDISQWEGSGINPMQEINGFWLGSSLKISPMEQVDVLKTVFQKQSIYSDDQINVLKNVMLYDEVNGYKIYGKTGTNQNKEGWYVGVAQKNNEEYYYAVYLNDESSELSVSGTTAREIVLNIFESEY